MEVQMNGILMGLLARVSPGDHPIETQIKLLKEWAERQHVKYEIFEDERVSGSLSTRPGLEKLREKIESGVIKDVAVYRIDRFFRNTLAGLQFLKFLLQEKKGCFYSISEGIDSKTPFGMMMITNLLSWSEYNLSVMKDAQKKGIDRKRDPVTGNCPWGGRKKGQMVKVDHEKVKSIHLKYENGWKVTAIARSEKMSRPTIYKYLKILKPSQTPQDALESTISCKGDLGATVAIAAA